MARLAPATLTTGKHSYQLKAQALVLISAGALAAVALTGCGLGKADVSTAAIVSPALNGKTFGGPNPVIGATVKLYTTGNSSGQSTGYGVATMRQEANAVSNPVGYPSGDTDTGGNFSFAGGYTCPAGQFAYIVSAGGNTGASSGANGATVTNGTATWDGILSTTVSNGGTGYTSVTPPAVTITPAGGDTTGNGAAATANVNPSGIVTSLTITNAGNAYTALPTITIAPPTSGTTALASVVTIATGGGISSIPVATPGSGYLSATVTITPTDSNGSGATAVPVFNNSNGGVSSITITNPGTGYDAPPNVVISPPTGNVNAANSNAVLVAALGRCEDLYANTSGGAYTGSPIFISELSTVATAYALGHFSSVSGSGASTVVQIGADAPNNVAPIGAALSTGCVANGTTCTTTAAAGLAHAFLNAATLVNVFQNPITNNGANTTVTPAYTSYLSGYSAAIPIVPQQLINTLGNILVSCVNSSGGVANDGSACGRIFSATTLTTSVPSYTTATPTNTFTAMVNLAYNPTLNGSTSAVSNFFNIAGAFTSVYSPSLSTTTNLNDYSIAIQYPAGATTAGLGYSTSTNSACSGGTCQGLLFPSSMALDINDNLYIANQTAITGTSVNLLSLSSTGKLQSETAVGPTLKQGLGLSVDALGNGYFANGSSNTGSGSNEIGYFTTGGGTTLSQFTVKAPGPTGAKIYATAVDQANNVWAVGTSSSYTLSMSGSGAGSFTGLSTITFTVPSNPPQAVSLLIDPNQNAWVVSATTLAVLQNTSTIGNTPTYTNSTAITPASLAGNPVASVTFSGSSPYLGYVGSYSTTAPGVQPFTPTFNNSGAGPGIASITGGSLEVGGSGISGTDVIEADGAGIVWVANTAGHTLTPLYNPSNSSTNVGYKIIPCVGGNTTCVVGFTSSIKPDFVNIDSSGTIWVGEQAGGLVQVIGAATPTWPLLSLGKTSQP